ncbi:MAG: hypothetical protein KAS32_13915 [Candidatus Peribacteraceae bacterium]|nr:hypothetical protein [Candidatus Peribacteraceae bacterium]
MTECAVEECNKEASFQIPFYKLNDGKLIVEFYEFRCKDHMLYTKNDKKHWSKDIRNKKNKV